MALNNRLSQFSPRQQLVLKELEKDPSRYAELQEKYINDSTTAKPGHEKQDKAFWKAFEKFRPGSEH